MRRVSRWHSGVVATVALAAAGFLLGSAALFLAAVVPLTYLGFTAVSSVADPSAALEAERRLTPRTPLPGESVAVELRVRNVSDRTLPDVRLVDGVPAELAVVDGSARCAATLRPGEETTLEYAVRPRRGTYTFDLPAVRVRSLSASVVATDSCPLEGDADLECRVPLDGVPIHRETVAVVGSVAADSGGPGYEFHSMREYRQGDPLNRVDWRRYAKRGELGTVQFREQEAATIVVIVDGRREAGLAADRGRPDGITLSAYAAVGTVGALAEAGHEVGLVALGVESQVPGVYAGPPAYVEPGTGAETGGRIASVCDAVAARGGAKSQPSRGNRSAATTGPVSSRAVRADGRGTVDLVDALVPAESQLVWVTPALDDEVIDLAAALRRRGYPTTVVSPNLATREDVGARLTAVTRRARLERLRRLDVPVIDWDPDTPLATALAVGFDEVIR